MCWVSKKGETRFSLPDVNEQFVQPELRIPCKLEETMLLLGCDSEQLVPCTNSTDLVPEFSPGGLVDTGVPHLLITVQLIACLEYTFQTVWHNDICVDQLGRGKDRVVWLTYQLEETRDTGQT